MEYQNGETRYIQGQLYYFNEPDNKWYPVPMRVAVGGGGRRNVTSNSFDLWTSGGATASSPEVGIFTTQYYSFFNFNGNSSIIAEKQFTYKGETQVTLSRFSIKDTSFGANAPVLVQVLVNGGVSGISVTMLPSDSNTEHTDLVNTAAIVDGDLITIRLTEVIPGTFTAGSYNINFTSIKAK